MVDKNINVYSIFDVEKNEIQNCLRNLYMDVECSNLENIIIRKGISIDGFLETDEEIYLFYSINANLYSLKISLYIHQISRFYSFFSTIDDFMTQFSIEGIKSEIQVTFHHQEDSTIDMTHKLSADVLNIMKNSMYGNVAFYYLDFYLNYLDLGDINISHLESLKFVGVYNTHIDNFHVTIGSKFEHNLEYIFINLKTWSDLKNILHNSNIYFAEITCFSTVGLELIEIPNISTLKLASYSSLREVLKKLSFPKLSLIDYIKL